MITVDNTNHPITFKGKTSDIKPTDRWGDIDIRNGDVFLEINTGEVYFFDGDTKTWTLPT